MNKNNIQSVLNTENLAVGYGKKIIIDDISFSVGAGEVFTLIGPNGAGKSTILKTITRQLKKLHGDICVFDEEISRLSDAGLSKQVSMVMTSAIKSELMTCRDIVATGRYPYTGRLGVLSDNDWEKVDEAIAMVHAEEVSDHDFSRISDGQRQRIMLARAICQETGILVLDEPTSYLDMRYKLDLLSSIRKLALSRGMAIIMSLHELDLAYKVSDKIACVKEGHIDKIDIPEQIFAGNYIQRLYGVDDDCFEPKTTQLFMQNKSKTDRFDVFVIGGAGTGIPVYNRLFRLNIPFAAGILQENDLEYAAAHAAAVKVVSQKAFTPFSKENYEKSKECIDACEMCICTIDEFGKCGEYNRKLMEYAAQHNKLKSMDDI